MLMMQDGEEPSLQIGARLPEMQLCKGAGEAILNEIVRGRFIVDKRPGVAPQARYLAFYILVDVRHERFRPPVPRCGTDPMEPYPQAWTSWQPRKLLRPPRHRPTAARRPEICKRRL